MERISKTLIIKGIENGIITFDMKDGCLTACIGDYWFFISSENDKTEEDYTKEHLAGLIYDTINSEPINDEEEDNATECLYYKAVLEESII